MAMILNDVAISTLAERLEQPEAQASSFWMENLRGFSYSPRYGIVGVQGAEGHTPRKSLGRQVAHYMLQAPFRRMGSGFANFRQYQRAGNTIAKRRGGAFDLAMMRQVLTLSLINEHFPVGQIDLPIVIIGDGWGAMTALVHSCLPQSKVVIVNLTKMLLVDLVYTRKAFPNIDICLASDVAEYQSALANDKISVIGVCASDSTMIGQGPVGLAINIASMQEMNAPVIADYFTSLRNAPGPATLFYCCNRIEKVLPDGTVVKFEDYPWRTDDRVLLDELCPWHQFYYRARPPFYRPYDGPIQHRLVILSKEQKDPSAHDHVEKVD